MNRSTLTTSVVTAILFSLLSPQAFAESACKGQPTNACSTNTQCYWVDGYQRKDGKTVSAYCRTKSQRSSRVKVKPIRDIAVKS